MSLSCNNLELYEPVNFVEFDQKGYLHSVDWSAGLEYWSGVTGMEYWSQGIMKNETCSYGTMHLLLYDPSEIINQSLHCKN